MFLNHQAYHLPCLFIKCNDCVYLRYWRSQSHALKEAKYNHDIDRAQLHIQRAESSIKQGMVP